MKTLNNVQLEQVEELKEVTSEEFADLMLKYTHFLTSEQLEKCYNETMELEEEFVHVMYDANYYSVVSEYCDINTDRIELAFNHYGEYALYMDELGQGLVVGCY